MVAVFALTMVLSMTNTSTAGTMSTAITTARILFDISVLPLACCARKFLSGERTSKSIGRVVRIRGKNFAVIFGGRGLIPVLLVRLRQQAQDKRIALVC